MPKKQKKEIDIDPIDFFYETDYTSSNLTKFIEIYKQVYNRIPCLECKKKHVEIKKEIFDLHKPIFGILRKKYCLDCWIKKIYSKIII